MLDQLVDENHDGKVSLRELNAHLNDPDLKAFFNARDVDVKDIELFFNMIASLNDKDGVEEVDIKTFVLGCLRLRGAASNADLQVLHFDMKYFFVRQFEELRKL